MDQSGCTICYKHDLMVLPPSFYRTWCKCLSPQCLCCQDWILKAKHLCGCNELSMGTYLQYTCRYMHVHSMYMYMWVGGVGLFYSVTVFCFGVCVCTHVLCTIVLHCLEITVFSLPPRPAVVCCINRLLDTRTDTKDPTDIFVCRAKKSTER